MPKLNEKHSNAHVSSSSPPLCFTLLVMTAAMSLVDEVVATTRRSFFRWETFGSSKARQKLSELLLAMEKREKDNGANTDLLQERLVAEIFRFERFQVQMQGVRKVQMGLHGAACLLLMLRSSRSLRI